MNCCPSCTLAGGGDRPGRVPGGIPFPSLAERFERLEELLQIAHQMWRGDERPCNLFDVPGSEFRDNIEHKLDVLRRHCAQAGRDYAEIEKTVASSFDLGEDPKAGAVALLAHLRELAAAGIDHVLYSPSRAWDEASFDAVAAILPDVHAIETQVSR
jgi:alkanesulfonate monooxygenase SsuD/methylene tetrahydromethanopterin reductase-like flavin-dependent oxidoreductase (luciferase family)